jgi:protoporphyrin/coproporphyrin ferrochelatase
MAGGHIQMEKRQIDGSDRGPIGVLLLDFGGPEREDEIRPYLGRLFKDPAILPFPGPLRGVLAHVFANARLSSARERYRAIGGHSPLPALARQRAQRLQARLGGPFHVRVAFSYTPPFVHDVIRDLAEHGVRRLVALPAFPQRSFATTDACLTLVSRAAAAHGVEVVEVGSEPENEGLLQALFEGLSPLLTEGAHVLFVAHGVPVRNVQRGDPYVDEVLRTAAALAQRLPTGTAWSVAFQSRVGPVRWVRPYLDNEIRRLGRMGVEALVVVPLSFFDENLETLYDLDVEAIRIAREAGIERFARAPAPGGHPAFLEGLVRRTLAAAHDGGWNGEADAAS